jgi:hypothetical protein
MPSYWVFVLDADGGMLAGLDIDFPDDASVIARAEAFLTHPGCACVEIWQGERRVAVLFPSGGRRRTLH